MCRGKEEGGLGVRDLATQNDALLLKILHRLHSIPLSRWATWVCLGERLLLDPRSSGLAGEHWAALRGLMPVYRALTRVSLGDGRMTAFWEDHWLPCGPMRCAFPALASHATCSEVSVWAVRNLGLDAVLVPRLSTSAAREHLLLLPLVGRAGEGEGEADHRSLILCDQKGGRLASSAAYGLFRLGGEGAGCPECGASLETPDHLIFGCPFARAFWCSLRLSTSGASVRALHLFDASMAVGSASPHAFVQLCCWHL